MTEIKAIVTKKAEEPTDPKKIGESKKPDLTGDVEGQSKYYTNAICWNCGGLNYVAADTAEWVSYPCKYCGKWFRL